MSDRVEQLSRRTLLERTATAAGALALGGTALVGVAGADVEHGLGSVALAEGPVKPNEAFKLRGFGDTESLEESCLPDEPVSTTYRRYEIEYCSSGTRATLYVPPDEVQPDSSGIYTVDSITPCLSTDRTVVSLRPAFYGGACGPGGW